LKTGWCSRFAIHAPGRKQPSHTATLGRLEIVDRDSRFDEGDSHSGSASDQFLLSVVVPAYNEADGLLVFHARHSKVLEGLTWRSEVGCPMGYVSREYRPLIVQRSPAARRLYADQRGCVRDILPAKRELTANDGAAGSAARRRRPCDPSAAKTDPELGRR
jgi:hypothetical protein